MSKEAMKLALEAAYLAGFNASGEGYNAEYPFGDHARNPEEDAVWIKDRDNALQEALAEQPAQQQEPKLPEFYARFEDGLVSVYQRREDATPLLLLRENLPDEQPAQPQQELVEWAKKAMELAADLSIESLRLGSYERKDIYEHSGRASWQTVEVREKREDARERLRQHLYTSPSAQGEQQ